MTKPVGVSWMMNYRKALRERREPSPRWLMKKAISELVDRAEAEDRERQLIQERWNPYQETGVRIPRESIVN